MTLANKVQQFISDSDIAHQIVHGDVNTTVTTEGGPVPSFAKKIDSLLSGLASPHGATSVTFTPPGTGAVSRSVENKLRDVVSVKDFGAVGDGVADDTAAIQAAYDASLGVRFPAGSYKTSRPIVKTSSHVTLADKRGATIVADANFVAGNVTRTYVDTAGATQTLTWNDKAIFYLVCPTNSYLTDVVVDGLAFDLLSDGSVGVFNAQRVAHSSFRNLFCDTSAYFVKGYDLWMIEWANIRSRFSKDHFDINVGTSNTFRNVHCDGKFSTGGTGFSFSNVSYSAMEACGADSVDRAYYFNGGEDFTLNGCGCESFSRLIQVTGGANITVNGGSLAIYKAASATGTFTPYQFDGANTKVTFSGTWLGIKNTASAGGTYAKMSLSNGAQVLMLNCRVPVELDPVKWWFISDANSALSVIDPVTGTRTDDYHGRKGASGSDKRFDYTKTVTAGSAQSVFRIDNSHYGDSTTGSIKVTLFNNYTPDIGFSGTQLYTFSCFKETTSSAVLTKYADSIAVTNTGGSALGTITATLVRNGDNTVDFQYTIPAAYGDTKVIVSIEYTSLSAANVTNEVITGV